MKEIGTIKDFHSKKCYDLYMYAVSIAKQINDYINKGYLIINEEGIQTNKFLFYTDDNPCIAVKLNENSTLIYLGSSWDSNGKVWISGDGESKLTIRKLFNDIKIINPEHIVKLKF